MNVDANIELHLHRQEKLSALADNGREVAPAQIRSRQAGSDA